MLSVSGDQCEERRLENWREAWDEQEKVHSFRRYTRFRSISTVFLNTRDLFLMLMRNAIYIWQGPKICRRATRSSKSLSFNLLYTGRRKRKISDHSFKSHNLSNVHKRKNNLSRFVQSFKIPFYSVYCYFIFMLIDVRPHFGVKIIVYFIHADGACIGRLISMNTNKTKSDKGHVFVFVKADIILQLLYSYPCNPAPQLRQTPHHSKIPTCCPYIYKRDTGIDQVVRGEKD